MCLVSVIWTDSDNKNNKNDNTHKQVLYRGFLLPALAAALPLRLAVPCSAAVFAAHHGSPELTLPLFGLGAAWAGLYLASGNLAVPVAVHALWNARVFIGSLLGA